MYNPTAPNDPGPGQRGWDVVIVIGGIHGEGEGEKKNRSSCFAVQRLSGPDELASNRARLASATQGLAETNPQKS